MNSAFTKLAASLAARNSARFLKGVGLSAAGGAALSHILDLGAYNLDDAVRYGKSYYAPLLEAIGQKELASSVINEANKAFIANPALGDPNFLKPWHWYLTGLGAAHGAVNFKPLVPPPKPPVKPKSFIEKVLAIGSSATPQKTASFSGIKKYLGNKSTSGAVAAGAGIFGGIGAAKNLAVLKALRSSSGGHSMFREGIGDEHFLHKVLGHVYNQDSLHNMENYINPYLKNMGEVILDPDNAAKAYATMGGIGLGLGALKGGLLGYSAKRAAGSNNRYNELRELLRKRFK